MKNFLFGFLAAILLPVIGMLIFLRLGGADVNADVAAPAWQSWLMNIAVHASVKRNAPAAGEPVSHTEADLIAGGTLYVNGCAGCHWGLGRPPRKRAYFFPPPEFAHVGTQYSEAEVMWIVKHGIRRTGMSAYATSYTDEQLSSLAGFVRSMKDLPPNVLTALQTKNP